MIAALPLSVSAAGEYVPGNPRWSGYQNQVQWDRPAGAASGDSFEYEAQLLLGDDVVESKAVEIDTYLFFTNDVVTRPQEEYTIRVRARWIMIVGDPDGQYMVADVGEAEPPHEHSYRKASAEKIDLARRTIFEMVEEGEKVTIPKLIAKTGLSRGFFYKNPMVRQALDKALEQQVGMIDPRRSVLDMAMDNEIVALHERIRELQQENQRLRAENEKMQKALSRRNDKLLRNL